MPAARQTVAKNANKHLSTKSKNQHKSQKREKMS
jgi:hypothetical protein